MTNLAPKGVSSFTTPGDATPASRSPLFSRFVRNKENACLKQTRTMKRSTR
jgi:hypothetical protein